MTPESEPESFSGVLVTIHLIRRLVFVVIRVEKVHPLVGTTAINNSYNSLSYINTTRIGKTKQLCGNRTPTGRTKFRVFPISASVDITVNLGKKCFICLL